MDADRSDRLARSIAAPVSRRSLVKTVAGGVAAAVVAALGGGSAAAAYRRCTLPNGRSGRLCNGVCLDTANDPKNCGACGRVCPSGTFCCNGWCADPARNAPGCCPPSISCGGVCTNPYSDRTNCGACGVVCRSDQDCCDGRCLTRGTAQNCEAFSVCGGGFVCDANANGPGQPGCVCPAGADCALN
jgi:hypothetical protein